MNTVMGVDLGTQSIKVIIYNPETKKILQQASSPLELISGEDGSREQLAQWWINGFHQCLNQCSEQIKATIVAIGVSGQQHGFVPVDANGEVLAPVKLWCDTSTTKECDDITQAAGGEQQCIALGGNTIAVGYTASKILWLKKNKPELYRRLATVMLPHDYLNFYLTGQRVMEYGDASGSGLLDVRQRCWSADLIEAIDATGHLSDCFPDLIDAEQSIGEIHPELAQQLGLQHRVIVSTGGGDNMMAAIGTGNIKDGKLTASMGTSGTLFGFSSKPVIDAEAELAAFCSSSGGWLALLCTMNCTVATENLRNLFHLGVDKIDPLASSIAAGSDGVITLPFYNGERTPALPNAKAVIFGLDTQNTTQAHLLRSAMEAAVFGLKNGLLAFSRCGMYFDEVTLTGGGSSSQLWCQICADILELPVKVLECNENAALGAALQALWCYTLNEKKENTSLETLIEEHLALDNYGYFIPDAEHVSIYNGIYTHYTQLLNTLSPLYKQ